jgi:hypothetical protein
MFLGKSIPDSDIQLYVNRENAQLGTCMRRQCQEFEEETEVWSVYSSLDGGFVNLCAFHLLKYLDHGYGKYTAEGEMETLNWAQATFYDIHHKANWNLFCTKCNCVQLFSGTATRFPYHRKTFRGWCTYCGEILSGLAPNLYREKRHMLKQIYLDITHEKELDDAESKRCLKHNPWNTLKLIHQL